MFDKLYQDIINGNIFPLTKEELKNKSPAEVEKLKRNNSHRKSEYKKEAERSGLVVDGVISYHSENYDAYNYASILTIKNSGNEIEIIFSKNSPNPNNSYLGTLPTYAIRITEVGGIYIVHSM